MPAVGNMNGMSHDDAVAHVLANNPSFAVGKMTIRSVEYRVFTNAPPHLRALFQGGRAAHSDGAADYLSFGDERWTYDEFCREAKEIANVLEVRFGIGPQDRVAIAMRNLPELMMLVAAITSLGAVCVFMNAWWTTQELDYAINDSGASLVFADSDRIERLQQIEKARKVQVVGVRDAKGQPHPYLDDLRAEIGARNPGWSPEWSDVDIDADDDFAIMYSSGTTGHPKGVVLTHRGVISALFSWLFQAAMAPLMAPPDPGAPEPPRLSALIATPLFHVTATHPLFLLSVPAGARIVLLPKWDPELAVRTIRDEKITRFVGVPTQCADLISAADAMGEDLETLDYMGSGGAKRPPAQVGELAQRFPHAAVATGWGMTETNAIGIGMSGPDYVARPEAAGRLHAPLQDIEIRGADGRALPIGEVGEITVKGPSNMRCYLNKPKATAEVLRDGWLHTGDLGKIDAEGIVTIVDRKKNIIIRGGENIACLDVEAALHRHPAVAEACVFPVPDDRLGEIVGAGVQTRPGQSVTAAELAEFLAGHIARFKIPEHFWIDAAPLPRGATAKTDRRALRAACLDRLAAKTTVT